MFHAIILSFHAPHDVRFSAKKSRLADIDAKDFPNQGRVSRASLPDLC